MRVDDRAPTGHVRTPGYVRGKPGVVVSVGGMWPNPERLAYGLPDVDRVRLYTVEFAQPELWPDYRGAVHDRVTCDLYEHWLIADESRERR